MKKTVSLNGEWELYYFEQDSLKINNPFELDNKNAPKIKAYVPGNVELDLKRAGIIKGDLFKGMATKQNEKYEEYEWWYKKEFTVPDTKCGERIYICFGAVDCFAHYYINGKEIFTSENAFTEQKIDLTDYIKTNEVNVIHVNIKSAVIYALNQEYNHILAELDSGFQAYIRKPAHSFGWDIFPRCVSAGIWRDTYLEIQDEYEFTDFSYSVMSADKQKAAIKFQAVVRVPAKEFKKDVQIHVKGKCKDSVFEYTASMNNFKTARFRVNVDNPKLWMPFGYGEANVYDLIYELLIDGIVKATGKMNVGIRTVTLSRTKSLKEQNPCFKFNVNGIDIMCKGSNWVPLDAYHSRDREKYEKALNLFSDTYCNMLRVWGGGVYEQEQFYDYCDRHGIMVWQDFMMACKMPSQDEKTLNNFKSEAKWAIKKLRHHPSIVLWSGDNEIDGAIVWSGKKPSINKITRQILPDLIAENDSRRPYLESSPYIADEYSENYKLREDIFPEQHLWGSRDYFKAGFYSNSKALFVSETGYHGCPAVCSVKKIVDNDCIWPINNEQWVLHSSDQKQNDARVKLMAEQISQFFDFVPDNIDDFSLASQISQAEAKKYFIERVRIKKGEKSGILWWNMLDGWPQMSDAVVDYFFEKKLAYGYIKRSQTPVAIMIDEMKDWCYTVIATNDTLSDITGEYKIYDIDTNEVLLSGAFEVLKNQNAVLGKIRMMYPEKRFLVIEWTINNKKYYNHYLCGTIPFDYQKYKQQINKFNNIVAPNRQIGE